MLTWDSCSASSPRSTKTAPGTTHRFDLNQGWVYEETTVDGRPVLQCNSLEAYPHNVSYIWFAPNHVRAFRRAVYEMTGGYDATRDVLDDQDIMCRLYQLTDFHLIDECLYLQRMHREYAARDRDQRTHPEGDRCSIRPLRRTKCVGLGEPSRVEVALPRFEGEQACGYVGWTPLPKGSTPTSSVTCRRASTCPTRVSELILAVGFLSRTSRTRWDLQRVLSVACSWWPVADPDAEHGRQRSVSRSDACRLLQREFLLVLHRPGLCPVRARTLCRFQVSRLVTYFPSDWHEQHKISYVCANLIAVKDGPRQGGL